MAARASSIEATGLDPEAATALDRPRFVEGEVEIPPTRRRPKFEGARPSPEPAAEAGAAVRRILGGPAPWLFLFVLGLVGGVAGGAFGVWLALR